MGDLDGDGDIDAFLARKNTSHPANGVWLNNGDRTFTAAPDQLGVNTSYDVALADLDGDQDLDAFVQAMGSHLKS